MRLNETEAGPIAWSYLELGSTYTPAEQVLSSTRVGMLRRTRRCGFGWRYLG